MTVLPPSTCRLCKSPPLPHRALCLRHHQRAEAVTAARLEAQHSQAQASALVHRNGDRAWRRWEQGEVPVDEASFHLYCLLTNYPYPDPES